RAGAVDAAAAAGVRRRAAGPARPARWRAAAPAGPGLYPAAVRAGADGVAPAQRLRGAADHQPRTGVRDRAGRAAAGRAARTQRPVLPGRGHRAWRGVPGPAAVTPARPPGGNGAGRRAAAGRLTQEASSTRLRPPSLAR